MALEPGGTHACGAAWEEHEAAGLSLFACVYGSKVQRNVLLSWKGNDVHRGGGQG